MSLTVELEECTPPVVPERFGSYDLVRITRPRIAGARSNGRIWVNSVTRDVVAEKRVDEERPFDIGLLDFDGLLVRTETQGGFFDARRFSLMREAGINRPDDDLAALMALVYRWEGTFPVSVASMVDRIQHRQGLDGHGIDESESVALGMLLDVDTLKRWVDINGQDVDDPCQSAPEIIARTLDRIGVQMLSDNPHIISRLAPIIPGAEDLVRAFRSDTPLCIASASGSKAIIEPILYAHAEAGQPYLFERFTKPPGYIVGEEDTGGIAKPQRGFYGQAAWCLAHLLQKDGLVPPEGFSLGDSVFIGNPIGGRSLADGMAVPDIAMTRRNGMHFISVGGDVTDVDTYGPLTASITDIQSLFRLIKSHKHGTNTTLKRLAATLHV